MNNDSYINHINFKLIEGLDKVSKYIADKYHTASGSAANKEKIYPQNIPVFCHNLSNYDTHLFIKDLWKTYLQVKLLAKADEKYINYTVNSGYVYKIVDNKRKFLYLSFVDTYKFMDSSIEELAKGLKQEDCKHINNFIKNSDILNN